METITITLNDAINQHSDLIDNLTFRNYVHNRERSPNITPEQWEMVYGAKVYEYEKILFLIGDFTCQQRNNSGRSE